MNNDNDNLRFGLIIRRPGMPGTWRIEATATSKAEALRYRETLRQRGYYVRIVPVSSQLDVWKACVSVIEQLEKEGY